MSKFIEKNYKILIGLILAFMLTVSVLNSWWDSAIFDETAHIPAGYSYLTMHDMRLNPEHPPLLKNLSAIPLVFMGLGFDTTQKFWTTDINGQWEAGHNLFWQMGNNADWLIFWARIPLVLLSLIFGLFIFKWTKELAGTIAGLFALTLYAFDPNVLGHNHFVTTDVGIAGFMLIVSYYFLRFIKDPTWKNVFIGGVFLAIVQLTKFSSILLLPIFSLVLIIYPLVKKIPAEEKSAFIFKLKKIGSYLGKGFVALIFSLVLVWIFYALNNYEMPKEKLAQTINFYFSPSDPNIKNIYTNKILLKLNDNAVSRPLSEYFLGIAMVFKRVSGGNGAYFMGQVSSKAFPAYFPTVFLVKETLPLLLFAFSALILALGKNILALIRHFTQKTEPTTSWFRALRDYIRHNIEVIAMFSFIILYSYISITGNLNIGFRHLFPILPFIYILTAKTIADFCKNIKNPLGKKSFFLTSFTLLIFLIAETVSAYPNYMSYFNKTVGGSKNGYQIVTDSNADWGQDIKRLKLFLEKNPEIDKIRVDYFGGADIKYYIKDKYIMWYDSKRPIEAGWYALSTNFLQGSIYDTTKKDTESYRWTKKIKPIYQIGTSIFIYHITEEDLKKLN